MTPKSPILFPFRKLRGFALDLNEAKQFGSLGLCPAPTAFFVN